MLVCLLALFVWSLRRALRELSEIDFALGVGQKLLGLDVPMGVRKFISEISRSLVYEPGPP
jgi:hypothetical protein